MIPPTCVEPFNGSLYFATLIKLKNSRRTMFMF